MKINQKHFATRISVEFGEEEFVYNLADNSGTNEFEAGYLELPKRARTVFERNLWLRNVGLIWMVLGLVSWISAYLGVGFLSAPIIWLGIGLGCYLFYRVTASAYSVYDLESGHSAWILQDKKHDQIQSELQKRCAEKALAVYRSNDFSDDPERHKAVLGWLLEKGAISKDQAEKRIHSLGLAPALSLVENKADTSKLH